MWAYKFLQKETHTQVPYFQTFFFENQEMLNLWFESETESLEDRPPFYLRFLKYGTQLLMLLLVTVAVVGQEGTAFNRMCDRRLECFNACSQMYFPSLFCQDANSWIDGSAGFPKPRPLRIVLNGNSFENFYKFPMPEYVRDNYAPAILEEPAPTDPATPARRSL
jgi:hypothetical protein